MSKVIRTPANVFAHDAYDIADFPSCKWYTPIDDADFVAAESWTFREAVHDQLISMGKVVDETGSVSNGALTVAGTVLSLSDQAEIHPSLDGTKDFLYLVVADWGADATNVQLGGGATAKVVLERKSGTGTSVVTDDSSVDNVLTSAAIDANSEVAAMYTDIANTDLYLVEGDGAAIGSPQNITLTATDDKDIDAAGITSISGGLVVYGTAIFEFDTIPTDVLAALSWMNYHWRNNNKVLYPGWKNKT